MSRYIRKDRCCRSSHARPEGTYTALDFLVTFPGYALCTTSSITSFMDVTKWLEGLGEEGNGTDCRPSRSSLHDERNLPQLTYLAESQMIDNSGSHEPSAAREASRRNLSLSRDVALGDQRNIASWNDRERSPGGSPSTLSEKPEGPARSLHRQGQFERQPRRKTRPDLYEPSSRVERRRWSAQENFEPTNVSKRPKRSKHAHRTSKSSEIRGAGRFIHKALMGD